MALLKLQKHRSAGYEDFSREFSISLEANLRRFRCTYTIVVAEQFVSVTDHIVLDMVRRCSIIEVCEFVCSVPSAITDLLVVKPPAALIVFFPTRTDGFIDPSCLALLCLAQQRLETVWFTRCSHGPWVW